MNHKLSGQIWIEINASALATQTKEQLKAQMLAQVSYQLDKQLMQAGNHLQFEVKATGATGYKVPMQLPAVVTALPQGDVKWGIDYNELTLTPSFADEPVFKPKDHLSKKALKEAQTVPPPAKKKGPGALPALGHAPNNKPGPEHEGTSIAGGYKQLKHGLYAAMYGGSPKSYNPKHFADSIATAVSKAKNSQSHSGFNGGWTAYEPPALPKLMGPNGQLVLSDSDVRELAKLIDDNPDAGAALAPSQRVLLAILQTIRPLTPLELEMYQRNAYQTLAVGWDDMGWSVKAAQAAQW